MNNADNCIYNPAVASPFNYYMNDYLDAVSRYNTGILYSQTMMPQTSAEQILRQPMIQQATWPSNTLGR